MYFTISFACTCNGGSSSPRFLRRVMGLDLGFLADRDADADAWLCFLPVEGREGLVEGEVEEEVEDEVEGTVSSIKVCGRRRGGGEEGEEGLERELEELGGGGNFKAVGREISSSSSGGGEGEREGEVLGERGKSQVLGMVIPAVRKNRIGEAKASNAWLGGGERRLADWYS